MQLRDHPLMSHKGTPNWPPFWSQGGGKDKRIIRDEIGILRYIHGVNAPSKNFYLVIEYEKEHYVGTLLFDDLTFCRQIADLLHQHIGRPIGKIGDVDVSHII